VGRPTSTPTTERIPQIEDIWRDRPVNRRRGRRIFGMSKRAVIAVPLMLAVAACAPADEGDDTAAEPTPTAADQCEKDNLALLNPGTLTIGTDSPAYDPWFRKNDPTNGQGYESAVAYAVAERLGFTEDEVEWVKVPFNTSYKPGEKNFDFDINQISITDAREEVVDFSDGYYQASQGVIALKDSPVADVTTVDELAGYNLGAQTGTTSLTAIRDVIQPDSEPAVFEDTNAAKQALQNGQVDAILADLPTAFYITAVEIPQGTIIGQFQPETGEQEEFGMLFEQGSELVPCVNEALAELREDGTLDQIEQEWLSDTVGVPELQ
jgi:polar amino acid transport system substrate-binding protein